MDPQDRRRPHRGHRRATGLLTLLLALLLLAATPGGAQASVFPDSTTFVSDGWIAYGANSTIIRKVTNSVYGSAMAYCAQPTKAGEFSGTYAKQRATAAWLSGGTGWTAAEAERQMRIVLWFAPGAPGYTSDLWPHVITDLPKWSNDYVLAHILVADIYTGDGAQAVDDVYGGTRATILRSVIGWDGQNGQTEFYQDSLRWRMVFDPLKTLESQVPTDRDVWDVYLLNTGSELQTYVGFDYCPQVEVTFSKTSARASLTTDNANYSLLGATYVVTCQEHGEQHTVTLDRLSGGAAVGTLKLEPNQTYVAREATSPLSYALATEPVRFSTGARDSSQPLSDQPRFGRLTLHKRDAATLGEAQGGATLAGAVYELTDSLGHKHTATTDETGTARFADDLPLGPYVIAETKASPGYNINPQTITGTVAPGEQAAETAEIPVDVRDGCDEAPIAFDLRVTKFAGNENNASGEVRRLANVRFDLVSNSTQEVVGWLVTNDRGEADTATGLGVDARFKTTAKTDDPAKPWFGKGKRPTNRVLGAIPYDRKGYTLREVQTPDGFEKAADITIEAESIVDGKTLSLEVYDKAVHQYLQVVKRDQDTGAVAPVAGFAFQLLDAQKHPVTLTTRYPSLHTSSEWETDATGSVTFPSELEAGTYYVRETQAQAPWVRDEQPQDLAVTLDDKTASLPVVSVQAQNRQATGSATIRKTCSDDGEPLAGAVYDVVAQEDVVDPTGRLWHCAGDVVATVTTDASGQATVEGLPLGTGAARYAFVETQAPEGHRLNPDPVPFTVRWVDDQTPVVVVTVTQEDAPTRVQVEKTVANSQEPLAGATFLYWRADDEAVAPPEAGFSAVALRTGSAESDVRLLPHTEGGVALVSALLPEGASLVLTHTKTGEERALTGSGADAAGNLACGTWTIAVDSDDPAVRKASGVKELAVEAGVAYTLTLQQRGWFGLLGWTLEVGAQSPLEQAQPLAFDAENDLYALPQWPTGRWDLYVDGTLRGTLETQADALWCGRMGEDGSVEEQPTLLKPGCAPLQTEATDEQGHVVLEHLARGTWRFLEHTAPAGYLVDPAVHTLTIDDDGRVEGQDEGLLSVEDDYTKLQVSKRDITTEEEVPGARLSLWDEHDRLVATWVSTEEPHYLQALPPGEYRLREELTPHAYDQATEVSFSLAPTGELQTVTMQDEPIQVAGRIDKRQEVASPTHAYTQAAPTAAEGGPNREEAALEGQGLFCYELDYQNESNTWVDELTVTDPLEPVSANLARLVAVTTPAGSEDFDGCLNVWYQTNLCCGGESGGEAGAMLDDGDAGPSAAPDDEKAGPNATLDDGHQNPWLQHESTQAALGTDGRAVSYAGWRHWKTVSCTEPETLWVADLDLQEGEHVTAIRFEHGRVEAGFSTNPSQNWSREDLKDPHDDLAPRTRATTEMQTGGAQGFDARQLQLEPDTEMPGDRAEDEGSMPGDGTGDEGSMPGDGTGDESSMRGDGAGDEGDTPGGRAEDEGEMPESGGIEEEDGRTPEGEGPFSGSPAVMLMHVTDAYAPGALLLNSARIELYRNGGDEPGLSDEDGDLVNQTPVERLPRIDTTLTADGSHEALPEALVLTDRVECQGLEPGVEHRLQGSLVSKNTGELLAEASQTFVPGEADGVQELDFAVDASQLAGDDVVAFERLTIQDTDEAGTPCERLVASHEDLYDADQTVSIREAPPEEGESGPRLPQTGSVALLAGFCLAGVGASLGACWLRRR